MTSRTTIALCIVAILAVISVAYVAQRRKTPDTMSVYGKSFADLPHGNIIAAENSLNRVTPAGPPPQFKGKKAYGASFAHI